MAVQSIETTCCVVGGGPAGMMLGFLLARAGVRVTVLEKHADFLRDFRGDTVHPSTLELMHELGLLDEFLKLPHSEISHVTMQVGDERVLIGNFDTLPTKCHYIALMPQWNFLNFLAEHGKRYRTFDLHMLTEATDLIEDGGRVAGVRAKTPDGEFQIKADLVVGCDGRHSTVRERGGFKVVDLGAPMDVLWFRLSRRPDDTDEVFGHVEAGRMMVMLNRGDYWQCAYVIPKGGIDRVKSAGLDKFRRTVAEISPFVRDRVDEVKSWDDVKLLTVAVDRLERWYRTGLLCIGDAAHAMSPIGGVGINLAIQDAVAAANILAQPLRNGSVSVETLEAVQRRRMFATRIIQTMQIVMQNRLIAPALIEGKRPKAPLILKMMQWPFFNRIPARFFGLGVRRERIQTPDIARG
ncbi:MAG TPA: FAD-dependent oxidoreductase [Pseudolabrys sp.]|jgi:2-polyprenyl-6-methoxyphenol hydroxylase-like FAD-dependent oxidoreductase|nr:FAD-dependent oxidoreductase [Pseudolabrys sp.]